MITEMLMDGITVKTFENRAAMGIAAAKAAATTIQMLLTKQDEVNIMLAAAPSQNEFLGALKEEAIEWQRINAFHMDEYIGLPQNSQATFANYLQEHLFNKVPLKSIFTTS